MHYELVLPEDYDGLPDEPEQKFVALEAICRRNLNNLINDQSQLVSDQNIRMQYMAIVAAAASELGVPGVEFPQWLTDPLEGFSDFIRTTSTAVARIRLRKSKKSDALSVQLGVRTKGKIEHQIQQLRELIAASNLPEGRRKSLLSKLDDLSAELAKPRLNFAKSMAIIVAVSAAIAGGEKAIASAPQALLAITSLIGHDKDLEEQEQKRLGQSSELRALPAPESKPARVLFDLDDETSF